MGTIVSPIDDQLYHSRAVVAVTLLGVVAYTSLNHLLQLSLPDLSLPHGLDIHQIRLPGLHSARSHSLAVDTSYVSPIARW